MAYEDTFYGGIPVQGGGIDPNEEGYLARLARTALTPLAYLAETIDKPGRAIRGLLGGQGPEALLNLVPFSDAIGLTDPNDAVTGRDLLRKAGMADRADTWGNWAGGLATEAILDPLNFLTLGTKSSLTALGRDAVKGIGAPLAATAAERIAAKQSGLVGLRTPWFMDMLPGAVPGRLPLLTGDAGQAIAGGLGRAGDYLMHEAPLISKPLSSLESMFRYGAGWTGDRRYVQGSAGAVAAEKAALQAGFEPTVDLINTERQAIESLVSAGVPPEAAKDYFARAVVGAKERGFPESPLLHEIADPALRDQARSQLTQLAGVASGSLGEVYDATRQNARALGVVVPESPGLYDLDYFHRQSLAGTLRKGSQQTSRTIPAEVLPGGTNQLRDYISNPNFAGIAKQPIPAGMPISQWENLVEQQIQKNADSIFGNAKAHRDYLAAQIDPLTGTSPHMPPEHLAQLTDDVLKKKSDDMARFFAEVDPELVKKGEYFRNDPVSSAYEYTANLSRQAGPAQSVLTTLAKQAEPASAMYSKPGDYVNLREALNQVGQNATETLGPETLYGGKKSLLEELAATGKTNVTAPGAPGPIHTKLMDTVLENQVVPKELVDVLKKEIAGPGYESKFGLGQLADKLTSWFRTGVTVPFPAYHARNLWEGVLQQGLNGGLSPEAIKDTFQYLNGTLKDPVKVAQMQGYHAEAFANNAAFKGQALAYLGEPAINKTDRYLTPWVTQDPNKSTLQGVTDAITDRLSPKSGATRGESYLAPSIEKNQLVQAGVQTHNDVDNLTRFSQYVALRKQGYAPEAARDLVTQSQLDYSKLTPTERKLRQLIPFYSFSKGNLERLAQQSQDPGSLASLIRGATDAGTEGYVPGYISQGAAIALPGETEEGKKRYISGFSLPVEDELAGSLMALGQGDITGAGRRFLTTVNPLAKLAATLGTGRQIYSGRSLDEVTPGTLTSLGGLLPNSTANIMGEVVGATPFGRLLSTANSTIGGKDQAPLLRWLAGIKTQDIDQKMAESLAARDAVNRALMRTGMVSTAQQYYPKADYRDPANQPPELQYLLQLMKSMQEQQRQDRLNSQPLP